MKSGNIIIILMCLLSINFNLIDCKADRQSKIKKCENRFKNCKMECEKKWSIPSDQEMCFHGCEDKHYNCQKSAGMYAWSTAKNGLLIRNKPSQHGKKIGIIPMGKRVTILMENDKEVIIAGKRGRWTKVKMGKTAGWAFGGFLKKREMISFKQTIDSIDEIISDGKSLRDFISSSGFEFQYYRYSREDGITSGKKMKVSNRELEGTIKLQVKNDGQGWGAKSNVKEKRYILNFDFYKELDSFRGKYQTSINKKKQQATFSNEQYRLIIDLKWEGNKYNIKKIFFKDEDPG